MFADSKEIKEHCIGLGAGDDLYALFAAILTMRPWDKIVDQSIDHLLVPDTPEEKDELQVSWSLHTVIEVMIFLILNHAIMFCRNFIPYLLYHTCKWKTFV